MGRKKKYNEPTTTVAFRVPVSAKGKIKKLVTTYLITLQNERNYQLLDEEQRRQVR